jgi:hypothetical protein
MIPINRDMIIGDQYDGFNAFGNIVKMVITDKQTSDSGSIIFVSEEVKI